MFPLVIDKMNLRAMQDMLKLKDYNGAHIDAKAVEGYKLVFEFLTCVEAGGVCLFAKILLWELA